MYSSLKTYRSAKHPAVVKALEQYNAVLAVATPADKQMARLMEKAWHLEEVHRKQREKEAPLAAQRRRWLGIF